MRLEDHSQFYRGGSTGVLLIHGLGGTPSEIKTVAMGIHRAGFTVSCCQLKGHCGTIDELTASTWQDWVHSVESALVDLKKTCDSVFVGGLSAGAILALYQAQKNPEKIAGLLLYAPTLWYDGFSVPWYSFLLKYFIKTPFGKHYHFVEREPYGIKDKRIRDLIVRAMFSGDSASAGSMSTPSQSLKQFWALIDVTQPNIGLIKTPALIVHPREDDISDLSNAIYLQRRLNGPVQTVVLDDSYHLVTVDKQRNIVIDRSISFIEWVQQGISIPDVLEC